MISFYLNGSNEVYTGNPELNLLKYLRESKNLTAAKDGCSGQGVCGACTVEIDGKAALACTTKMKQLEGKHIVTLEGIPEKVKDIIAHAFIGKGAVQCGFCSPGLIMRTKALFAKTENPLRQEIIAAIKPHLCRCTGYVKIVDAIVEACKNLTSGSLTEIGVASGISESGTKYLAYETITGLRPFTDDIRKEEMLFGALKFSDYPRAKIEKIDISEAEKIPGVVKVFTANDIPGQRYTGLIFNDWPLMIDEGETTHYVGDVLAGVVAKDEETARFAVQKITIEYKVLTPVTDIFEALEAESPSVHRKTPNLLDSCIINRGSVEDEFSKADFISKGRYETQRIEHAFLESECAVAEPLDKDGIKIYSQTQGIYEDQRQICMLLNLLPNKVRVAQVPNGGGFGGKEDMTVQGHAALFAYILRQPVKVKLTREESIRMHPKRHPVIMDIELCADKSGKLKALKLKAWGDSGAYASVGNKVMERLAGHATGGYYVPALQIEALTVYTNNVPCGAMRGFGVPQINFALEGCIEDICEQGNFDSWKFRYDNALVDGLPTSTGQKVKDCGIRDCLNALKNDYYKSKFAGLATGIKNSGIGNGMADYCDVKICFEKNGRISLHHGWTEMGQGVHTIAIQVFCEETGIHPTKVDVICDTASNLKTGMTTSSRATILLGNAIIDACKSIKKDLRLFELTDLKGKTYYGNFTCNWTTKPGAETDEPITHYSYGYAAQLCILNDKGEIETIVAAHDAGKIMNPMLFEGQMQGSVHMGLGYALSENLPMKDGQFLSLKLKDCGILRSTEMPNVIIKGVEVSDRFGPYGAKGIGEIGLVPTAPAIANALFQFDKKRRFKLPINLEKQADQAKK
jgi:aldehyde oxidoreductase